MLLYRQINICEPEKKNPTKILSKNGMRAVYLGERQSVTVPFFAFTVIFTHSSFPKHQYPPLGMVVAPSTVIVLYGYLFLFVKCASFPI